MIKNKKIFVIIISLLASISLISIGYASWTITSGSVGASGNITSEDVLFNDDYSTVTKTKDSPLLYCDYGFVDSKDRVSIVKNGKLGVQISLSNLIAFRNKYGNNPIEVEVDFKINKKSNTFDLLNNEAALPLTYKLYNSKYDDITSSMSHNVTRNHELMTFKFVSNTNAPIDSFFIEFNWENKDSASNALQIDSNNWFYKNLRETLHQKDLFSFTVKLNSKGGNA